MRIQSPPTYIWSALIAAGLLAGGFFAGRLTTTDSNTQAVTGPATQASGESLGTSVRSPLLEPTPPASVTRLIAAWEPHQALVVALTHRDDIDTTIKISRLAGKYVDVLVLVPILEQTELMGRFMMRLGAEPDAAAIRSRIRVVPANVSSAWTRDYLPIYAMSRQGRLLMLDSRTVDLSSDPAGTIRMLQSTEGTHEYYRKLEQSVSDDIAPAFLASFLRTNFAIPAAVVRPPIYLDGGDFIHVAPHEALLSESTLRHNGGQEDALRTSLRSYFGIERAHFLDTLPGLTIDHLDYIVQCITEKTLIVAATPAPADSGQGYYDILHEQLVGVLNRNHAYLKEHFPEHRIVSIPMPPVIAPSREDVLERIRGRVVSEMAKRYKVDWDALNSSDVDDPNRQAAVETFSKRLHEQFGNVNLARRDDLDRVTRHFLGEPLDDLEKLTMDRTVVYRTYVNSLYIHARDGRRAVIIPRYKPRNAVEEREFPKLEEAVLAAYREAAPGADLHWFDCDEIIEGFGAVHCITHLVPDYETARKR